MDRNIFRYDCGAGERFADPLELQLALWEALPDLDALCDQVWPPQGQPEQPPEVWGPALKRIVHGVRAVFGLPAVDPGTGAGVDGEQVVEVLQQFWAFWAQKKSSTPASPSGAPTSQAPTECPGPARPPITAGWWASLQTSLACAGFGPTAAPAAAP